MTNYNGFMVAVAHQSNDIFLYLSGYFSAASFYKKLKSSNSWETSSFDFIFERYCKITPFLVIALLF